MAKKQDKPLPKDPNARAFEIVKQATETPEETSPKTSGKEDTDNNGK